MQKINIFLSKNSTLLILIILLFVFILFKIPYLYLPYFWDELGVYAPGALKMLDNNSIGILPNNLEPEYSRGHPLFFYFYTSLFMKIFGDSHIIGHISALCISCATIYIFYRLCQFLEFGNWIFFPIIILIIQPVFFAMSVLILPEMLLTLGFCIGFWGIIKQHWILYFIGSSLAVLTKEPGIILPVSAIGYSLYLFVFSKSISSKILLKQILFYMFPIFIFIIFLCIQKYQNGWYFFPYHIGFIKSELSEILNTLILILKDLFIRQGRVFLSIFLLLHLILIKKIAIKAIVSKIYLLSIMIILVAIGFSSINFYLARYLLFIYPFYIIICCISIFSIFKYFIKNEKTLFLIKSFTTILICIISINFMNKKAFNDSFDISYITTINCVKTCVNDVEKQEWKHDLIRANFPIFQALNDKRNGYLNDKPIKNTDNPNIKTKYFLYFNLDNEVISNQLKNYTIIKTYDNAFCHIKILEFK